MRGLAGAGAKRALARALGYAVVVAWAGLFLSRNFSFTIPFGFDDTYYLALSRSFAEGQGYRDPASPFPANLQVGPSAFPLFLSLFWRLGLPFSAMKACMAALMALGAGFAFLFLELLLGAWPAALVAMAWSSSLMFVFFGDATHTENLFIPVFYLAAYLAYAPYFPARDGRTLGADGRRGWGGPALWVVAARTRTIGLFFLAAELARLLRNRRPVAALAGVGALGAWIWAEGRMVAPGLPSAAYFDGFLQDYPFATRPAAAALSLARMVAANAWGFAGSLYANLILPGYYAARPMDGPKRAVVLAVAACGAAGFALAWRRWPALRPLWAAFLAQSAFLMLWRNPLALFRYFLPFLPLLILCFALPWEALCRRLPWPRARGPAFALILMVIIAAQAPLGWKADCSGSRLARAGALAPVEAELRRGRPALVLAYDPYFAYLAAGVAAVAAREPGDLERIRPLLEGSKARPGPVWVFALDGPYGRPFQSTMENAGYRWEGPLAGGGGFSVYRLAFPAAGPGLAPQAGGRGPMTGPGPRPPVGGN